MRTNTVVHHAVHILQHLNGATVTLYTVDQLRHGKILDATHKLSPHTTQ